MQDQTEEAYFRRREQQERELGRLATPHLAAEAHSALADMYANKVEAIRNANQQPWPTHETDLLRFVRPVVVRQLSLHQLFQSS
jgi:hypothetical protein